MIQNSLSFIDDLDIRDKEMPDCSFILNYHNMDLFGPPVPQGKGIIF